MSDRAGKRRHLGVDRKLTHLSLIQGVINRLSTNSFLLKGWSVLLVSALFGVSAAGSRVKFVYLAYFPALILWGLDGYFLAVERTYRELYDQVTKIAPGQIDFRMDVSLYGKGTAGWASATFSKTIVWFHGILVFSIVLVMILQLGWWSNG